MNLQLLLQGAPATPGAGNPLIQMVPYLLIFVVFWFVLLAPMRKQQKKTKEMLAALKKGDKVVTSGGLHGVIREMGEGTVWVWFGSQKEGIKVEVARSAITGVVKEPEAPKDPSA